MTASLYLFPSSTSIIDSFLITNKLQAMNIITDTFDRGQYLLGDEFMHTIIFAGCSPYLKLKPDSQSDTQFCHFSLYNQPNKDKFIISHTQARPRCPDCNKIISDWKTHINEWEKNPLSMVGCPQCKKEHTAIALNWKQYAAKGSLLLQFHNVFPGEAVPSDSFLSELSLLTHSNWQFAWADSIIF